MLSIGLIADYCFLVNSASNVVIQKPSWIWWISFTINLIPIMVNWLNLLNLLYKNHWISTPKHFFLIGLNRWKAVKHVLSYPKKTLALSLQVESSLLWQCIGPANRSQPRNSSGKHFLKQNSHVFRWFPFLAPLFRSLCRFHAFSKTFLVFQFLASQTFETFVQMTQSPVLFDKEVWYFEVWS